MQRVWETPPLSHEVMRGPPGFLNSWWSLDVAGSTCSPGSAQWQSGSALGMQRPHLPWDSFLSANTAQVKEGLKYNKAWFSPLSLAIPRNTREVTGQGYCLCTTWQDRQNPSLMYGPNVTEQLKMEPFPTACKRINSGAKSWCQILSCTWCISRDLAGSLAKQSMCLCTFNIPSQTVCSNCSLGCVWHLRFLTGKYNTFLVTFWGGNLQVLILRYAAGKMNRGLNGKPAPHRATNTRCAVPIEGWSALRICH